MSSIVLCAKDSAPPQAQEYQDKIHQRNGDRVEDGGHIYIRKGDNR